MTQVVAFTIWSSLKPEDQKRLLDLQSKVRESEGAKKKV